MTPQPWRGLRKPSRSSGSPRGATAAGTGCGPIKSAEAPIARRETLELSPGSAFGLRLEGRERPSGCSRPRHCSGDLADCPGGFLLGVRLASNDQFDRWTVAGFLSAGAGGLLRVGLVQAGSCFVADRRLDVRERVAE